VTGDISRAPVLQETFAWFPPEAGPPIRKGAREISPVTLW